MQTFFLIHPDGNPVATNSLAQDCRQFLRNRGLEANGVWYYDEFNPDGPEFGVRVLMKGTSGDTSEDLKGHLNDFVGTRPEDLRIEDA